MTESTFPWAHHHHHPLLFFTGVSAGSQRHHLKSPPRAGLMESRYAQMHPAGREETAHLSGGARRWAALHINASYWWQTEGWGINIWNIFTVMKEKLAKGRSCLLCCIRPNVIYLCNTCLELMSADEPNNATVMKRLSLSDEKLSHCRCRYV